MIALKLFVFYISMYVKEVLLHMTGSAIYEDGSHHRLPYWDYFNAYNLYFGGIVSFFTNIFLNRGGLQSNQDKLFWKLPSPLIHDIALICTTYYNSQKSIILHIDNCYTHSQSKPNRMDYESLYTLTDPTATTVCWNHWCWVLHIYKYMHCTSFSNTQ